MKELVLTERSLKTYGIWGIEVVCKRCGRVFKSGDRVIKTRIRTGKHENPFYCPEHFYSEERAHRVHASMTSEAAPPKDRHLTHNM